MNITNKKQLAVGQRICIKDGYYLLKEPKPKNGTIKRITKNLISIEFDEPFDRGHSCNGYCRELGGWNFIFDDYILERIYFAENGEELE